MKQRDVYKTSALLVSHRLQDGFMLASHFYNAETNRMEAVDGKPMRDVHTSFMILREGKVIFDNTAVALGRVQDPYIREYIS
jgi:phospholipid/cholesterol/gamma-HCH transport system ATP-binding protein